MAPSFPHGFRVGGWMTRKPRLEAGSVLGPYILTPFQVLGNCIIPAMSASPCKRCRQRRERRPRKSCRDGEQDLTARPPHLIRSPAPDTLRSRSFYDLNKEEDREESLLIRPTIRDLVGRKSCRNRRRRLVCDPCAPSFGIAVKPP